MPDLTDDEFTVLLLADSGESMIPIGRWKAPILSLTTKGFMRKNDEVNYSITAAGRAARAARDAEDEDAMLGFFSGGKKAIEDREDEL